MSDPRRTERGSWRWDQDSAWVDYETAQEAVDSLHKHGGGEVRGWLAPLVAAPQPADNAQAGEQS